MKNVMSSLRAAKPNNKQASADKMTARKTVLAILAALAFICILTGTNSIHNISPINVSLNTPGAVASTGSGFIMSEDNNTALLFVDNHFQAYKKIPLNNASNNADLIIGVRPLGDRVFVLGAVRNTKGVYFKGATVAEYTPDGRFVQVRYSEDYDEEDYLVSSLLLDITLTAEGRVILLTSRPDCVEQIDITESTPRTVCRVPASAQMWYGLFLDSNDMILSEDRITFHRYNTDGYVETLSSDDVQAVHSTYYGRDEIAADSELDILLFYPEYQCLLRDDNGNPAYLLYTDENVMYLYDIEEDVHISGINKLKKTFALAISDVLYYLSIAYIAVMAAMLIIRFLKKENKVKSMLKLLAVLAVFAGIAGFYTHQSSQVLMACYEDRLISQSKQAGTLVCTHYRDMVDEICQAGILDWYDIPGNPERLRAMENELTLLARANGYDFSTYIGLAILWDGFCYQVVTTDDHLGVGEILTTAEMAESLFADGEDYPIRPYVNYGQTYSSCYCRIAGVDGGITAFMFVGYNTDHLISMQIESGMRMLLDLLVAATICYICIKALSDLRTSWQDYRAGRALGKKDLRVPLFGGVAAFLVTLICQFDSVVLVYAVRELCATLSDLEAARMTALPLSLYSLGIMLGSALPAMLAGRVRERLTAAAFCFSGVLAMLLAVFSLSAGNIYLFTAAKLIEGMTIGGAAYSVIYASPFGCKDPDTQRHLINATQTASVSAGAIGVFVGGYISEFLSQSMIFFVKGILCVVLGVICIMMFRDSAAEKPAARKRLLDFRNSGWSFYIKPQTVMLYLCCIFPSILFGRYRNYLYPIYSQNAGINAVMLSNIMLLSKAAAFFASDTMNVITKRYAPQKIMIVSYIVCSVCLVCFMISPSMIWAVITLFVITIFLRSGTTAGIFCQSELCDRLGYEKKDVQLCSETIRGIFDTLSSPIMGLFLALGNNYACAAVGIIGLTLILVYRLFQRGCKSTRAASGSVKGI